MIGAFFAALLLAAEPRVPIQRLSGWSAHGPDGGIVNQLAVDPSNQLVLYAATDLAGVFKSLDGGASWEQVSGGLPKKIDSLAIDPQQPSTVYISTGGDIAGSHDFVSDDGGLTWTPIASIAGEGPYFPPIVTSLVVDPHSSDTLYAGTTIPGFPGHIPATGMLSKSTDRGQSWQPLLSIGGEFGGVQQLLVDEGSSQTIFAIANHQLHVSRDAGAAWSVLPIDALFVGSLVPPRTDATRPLFEWLLSEHGRRRDLDHGQRRAQRRRARGILRRLDRPLDGVCEHACRRSWERRFRVELASAGHRAQHQTGNRILRRPDATLRPSVDSRVRRSLDDPMLARPGRRTVPVSRRRRSPGSSRLPRRS